jgi:hypothetical protein
MLSSDVGLHVFCPLEAGVQSSDNAIAVYFRYLVPVPGMRIRIILMWIRIQLLHFNADPDSAFQFNADPDPPELNSKPPL